MNLIIVGIFSLSFAIAKAPSTHHQLKDKLMMTSKSDLVQWVNSLVMNSAPSRMVGQVGHAKARTWLQEEILKADPKSSGHFSSVEFGPDIEEAKRFYQSDFDTKVEGKILKNHPDYIKWQRFTQHMKELSNKLKGIKGHNLIWEKAGLNPKKLLVVTAHYDTISHDPGTFMVKENSSMPGANFNASGVAVALGLIKLLSQFDFNYSVQVAFLDWQGVGFLGSHQHAKEIKASGKEIIQVFNLEMLGQDTSYFDKTKKLGNMRVYTQKDEKAEKLVSRLSVHGPKMTSKVKFDVVGNDFENSDNFRYWEQGLPCATFTQNWEDDFNPKFYQTAADTPETLNHETLHLGYLYIGGVVAGTLLDITK